MAGGVISGDYCDLRFIKSRKVAVISVEIPIEAAAEFVRLFGTPNPAEGVPVAMARLQAPKSEPEVTKPHRRMNELPMPQQAALLCDRPAFARFVKERFGADNPVTFLRERCGVSSRSLLKPGSREGEIFFQLQAEFDVWMKVPA